MQGAVHRSECSAKVKVCQSVVNFPVFSEEPLEDGKEFQVVSREEEEEEEGVAIALGSRKRKALPTEVGRENKRIRTEDPDSVLEI